jgi:6-phosphogluconate dehydrogenase
VWLMVPAGAATELMIEDVWPELERGDVIVDGGNAYYKESERRAAALASAGIHFIDCGVSGGVWGLDNGYTLMYGGASEAARIVLPYMKILAPAEDRGHLHCGAPGAGHFVKMIHNGIEYGMMQAYAEGFALIENKRDLALDVAAIAQTWRHGSVVRSWLLDLTAEFLEEDATLGNVAPVVADSGEGRWTIQEAIEQGMPAPVLSLALMARFQSQGRGEYAAKLLAMMRKGFGGHLVKQVDGAKP